MSDAQIDFLDPFDDCAWLPARELFRKLGFEPMAPTALDNFQLRGRLWEFIYAMAGRRYYLDDTDHLSERELYTWLHDVWFIEETADIPFEAEWNCRIDASESSTGKDPGPWLRYYASKEDRELWAVDFPEDEIPPHEDPPYDRDRWLPEPPGIPVSTDDETMFFEDEEEEENDDPLGLKTVEAEIQSERTREEIAAITGGEQPEGWQRPIDRLQKEEGTLLPPAELTDETLAAKLWELLHNLACRGFYVLHTDHLSDRELYSELWTRGLRDEALLPGKSNTGGWFHDFIGSGSDDHNQVWLRFYANEEDRAKHERDWPKDPMPSKEKPPFNRDWRLPKGPF